MQINGISNSCRTIGELAGADKAANNEERQRDAVQKSGNGAFDMSDSGESEAVGVTLELSDSAMQMNLEQLNQQMESAKAAGDGIKDIGKMMLIAARIANGDHVPPQDEKKLMEFNKELYMAAKAAAALSMNKHPKKYDSVDEDEEDNALRDQIRELDSEQSQKSIESEGVQSSESEVAESAESTVTESE